MPKRTLKERGDAADCRECALFLLQNAGGKALTHKSFDEAEEYHQNNHNEGQAGHAKAEVPKRKKSKAALEAVSAPPSSASPETHQFQSIFLEVVIGEMPMNNKLDPSQDVVVNEVVTNTVLQRPASAKNCYQDVFGQKYGEEQNRPVVSALIEGLVSIVAGENEVIARESPVRYLIKQENEDGTCCYVEVSPPGEKARALPEQLLSDLSHDERKGKKWKKDVIISSLVPALDELGQLKKFWIPRVIIEAKGDDATAEDLYQASTNSWKHQLKDLQDGKPIGRIYFEVWGTFKCFYGIQDIFGYVTVENGIVTEESYKLYEQTHLKQRNMWGKKGFPEESFQRCPKTLEDLQAAYDTVAKLYNNKFHTTLPSVHGVEDFPVGVVYFDPRPSCLPGGKLLVQKVSAAMFVQGHVRILGSNWVIPSNPAEYSTANARLLENYKKYMDRTNKTVADMYIDTERIKTPLPERQVFRTLEEAGVSDYVESVAEDVSRGLVVTSSLGPSETSTAQQGDGGDVLRNPPSREVVLTWTNEDVKRLVRLASGGRTMDGAVAASRIDGPLLLEMEREDLTAWFTEIGLRQVYPILMMKRWIREVQNS